MHLFWLTLTTGLGALAEARDSPALNGKAPDFALDTEHIGVIHTIEPIDSLNENGTHRGPGGYTEDGETWSCLNDCNIEMNDCETVRATMQDMGGDSGWWAVSSSVGCNSWQYGNCKATFCPRDPEESNDSNKDEQEDELHFDDDLERKDMAVSTLKLAKYMDILGMICGDEGRRAYMKADNGTWEFWLSEAGWHQD